MSGAIRIHYEPGTWTPGDPLFVRPMSNAQGNHVRRLIDLVQPEADTEECSCQDRARWPAPLQQHRIHERYELAEIVARARAEEQEIAS